MSEAETQPDPIQSGWYWTGTETVWVIGTSWTHKTVYYQYKCAGGGVMGWEWSKHLHHWQRVHEAVRQSEKGFGWSPPDTAPPTPPRKRG